MQEKHFKLTLNWQAKDEHSGSQYISVFFITQATTLGSKYLLEHLRKLSTTIIYKDHMSALWKFVTK